MTYHLDKCLIQKYAFDYVKEGTMDFWSIEHGDMGWYYECTVTFNPRYWSFINTIDNGVRLAVADMFKPLIREYACFMCRYSVEYHENNYPHIHFQIICPREMSPQIQHQIHQRFCRRYGRSDWYQTGHEDKFHEASGMCWSEYIKKDVEKNEVNGKRHYFEYVVQFR